MTVKEETMKASVQGTVRSYRSRSEYLKKKDALAEIVDNSLDSGASNVDIRITSNHLEVRDDGKGCSDFDKMCTLNGSNDDATKRTGRFGQGLKVAAIRFGDRMIVDSRTAEARMQFAVDWPTVTGPVPVDTDPYGGETGTIIRIEAMHEKWRKSDIEAAGRDLSWTYRPSLVDGKQISINGTAIEAAPLPRLRAEQSVHLEFSDGRTADVTAGLLVGDGHNPGIEIFYKIRHVRREPPPPGTSGFYAVVTILDAPGAIVREGGPGVWRLALHKTDLPREQIQELNDAIGRHFGTLIKASQVEPWDFKHMSNLDVKVRRAGGESTKRITPPDGPGPSNGRPGKGENNNAGEEDGCESDHGGLKIIPEKMKHQWMLGEARQGAIVAINTKNPFVKRLWEAKSKSAAAEDCIAMLCGMLLAERPHGQQMELPLSKETHKAIGRGLVSYWKSKYGCRKETRSVA